MSAASRLARPGQSLREMNRCSGLHIAVQIERDVGVDGQLHRFDAQRLQFIDQLHRGQAAKHRGANRGDIVAGAPPACDDTLSDRAQIEPVAVKLSRPRKS